MNGLNVAGSSAFLGAMAPEVVPVAHATEHIATDGRLSHNDRARLRAIPSYKNAWSTVWLFGQNILILVAAAQLNHVVSWIIAFLLMGRAHAQFASLMHEAAHRLLFSNKAINDFVGNWILGYFVMTSTQAYRRVHMAHHKREFGPNEPDIPLYANYPISRASLRRKLIRDATGQTGYKLLRNQFKNLRSTDTRVRHTLWKMIGVQVAIAAAFTLAGYWWMYPVMWVAPYLTVWRIINRLRSIAEHGGLREDDDRRFTTHSVAQHWGARFFLVPYSIGFHMAHHVDAGVPFRHLKEYHRLLHEANYLDNALEYPSYLALWKSLSSPA
jgi:fatty acid desaturase